MVIEVNKVPLSIDHKYCLIEAANWAWLNTHREELQLGPRLPLFPRRNLKVLNTQSTYSRTGCEIVIAILHFFFLFFFLMTSKPASSTNPLFTWSLDGLLYAESWLFPFFNNGFNVSLTNAQFFL